MLGRPEENFALLTWRAASLPERAELSNLGALLAGPLGETLARRWCRVAFDNVDEAPALLTERLSIDGLGAPAAVLERLAKPVASVEAAPPWWPPLEDALARLATEPLPGITTKLAFEEAVAGLWRTAWQRVEDRIVAIPPAGRRKAFDFAAIREGLYRSLVQLLASKVDRTLVLELNVARLEGRLHGATPADRYEDFIRGLEAGGLRRVLLEYPVLARLLSEVTSGWVDATAEILERLSTDLPALGRAFGTREALGPLVAVDTSCSDPHARQRTVALLTFASGGRAVYKPRSLAVDVAFGELLHVLRSWGIDVGPPTRRLLPRDGYGWEEHVVRLPCTDREGVRRFYRRQGAFLMVMYVLGGTDFHRENVIAHGDTPVYVDLETLFHQAPPDEQRGPLGLALRAIEGSVLGTGLLPMWISGPAGVAELGGLGGQAGQQTPRPVPRWEEPATDQMRQGDAIVAMPGSENLPVLDGRSVEPDDYVEELVNGFRRTYAILLAHRRELEAEGGPIRAFAGAAIRHIARPTQIYYRLLRDSVHPDHLRDALDRDMLFDRLWVGRAAEPKRTGLVSLEQRDLRRGDIPVFRTRPDARSLWTSDGCELTEYFEQTGLDRSLGRLAALDSADLAQQVHLIRSSMATRQLGHRGTLDRRTTPAEVDPVGPAELLAEAERIGARLRDLAYSDGGGATWVGLTATPDERWTVAPVGADVYAGNAGIALFLAQLGRLSGDERHTALARGAIAAVKAGLDEYVSTAAVGGIGGSASVVYALSSLATIWGDPDLHAVAVSAVRTLAPAVDADDRLDVLVGCAGAIPVLLAMAGRSQQPEPMALARRCGDRLLDAAIAVSPGVVGWRSRVGDAPLAGFSHGAAGIAWAMYMLGAATEDERYAIAARGALAYERTLFVAARGNWLDLRGGAKGEPTTPTAWCHGAPGVALGRLLSLSFHDNSDVRGEIGIALETTLREGFGGDHSLCHGDFGAIDVLLVAAEVLGDERWRRAADHAGAAALVDRRARGAWRSGVPGGVETPGLFLGLAGIGYGLLRLCEPRSVPSVLSLRLPVELSRTGPERAD